MVTVLLTALVVQSQATAPAAPLPPPTGKPFQMVSKFPAPEAVQGVAVDGNSFYAIGNAVIGRYDRKTFIKTGEYKSGPEHPLQHMNGGAVFGSLLYCSHSNYPNTPMVSSIEIFDVKSMRHVRSQSFGLDAGSLVWVDRHAGYWWVCFGHYNGRGGEPGKTNAQTVLVKFDDQWRRVGAYAFPPALIARWDGMTASGGAFGPDGLLYCTGHHAPEIHVLRLPKAGGILELVEVLPSPIEGQGIAIDLKNKQLIQMQRKERAVYIFEMSR